jgi:hypothetical protein
MIVVAFANTMGAKSANGLVIFSCFLLRWCILLSRSFRGWGLDFIDQIHPPSSMGHGFILVTIGYFTKWNVVVLLKNMTHKEVIEFIT